MDESSQASLITGFTFRKPETLELIDRKAACKSCMMFRRCGKVKAGVGSADFHAVTWCLVEGVMAVEPNQAVLHFMRTKNFSGRLAQCTAHCFLILCLTALSTTLL